MIQRCRYIFHAVASSDPRQVQKDGIHIIRKIDRRYTLFLLVKEQINTRRKEGKCILEAQKMCSRTAEDH